MAGSQNQVTKQTGLQGVSGQVEWQNPELSVMVHFRRQPS